VTQACHQGSHEVISDLKPIAKNRPSAARRSSRRAPGQGRAEDRIRATFKVFVPLDEYGPIPGRAKGREGPAARSGHKHPPQIVTDKARGAGSTKSFNFAAQERDPAGLQEGGPPRAITSTLTRSRSGDHRRTAPDGQGGHPGSRQLTHESASAWLKAVGLG